MAFVAPTALPTAAALSAFTRPALCSSRRPSAFSPAAQVPNRRVRPATQTNMAVGTQTQQAPSVFKQALLERLADVNFGRTVVDNRKEQDEIETLIKSVEATNRSVSPGADPNLNGVWSMIYTTSASILQPGRPAFLQAQRIEQTLDAPTLTARNEEAFKFGPVEITNAVDAKLSPVSNIRFDVNFVEFQVAGVFKFNVENNPRFSGWLEVTYLDEDMRISRGQKGNVFVLVKKRT